MFFDFDTTATSPVLPQVMELYALHLTRAANNPSSAHAGGIQAAGLYEEARRSIARSLDCLPEEVFFTSGGTESINLAIKGTAGLVRRKPKRAVTSAGEHDAVLASMAWLEESQGFDLIRIPLLKTGRFDRSALEGALRDNPPFLVSLITVSNETGAINDPQSFVPAIRNLAPQAVIHSDIVQACGKLPFSFRASGLDLASAAGHKIGAPKGTGLLIKRVNIQLMPLLHGGGQQSGVRSGTVDVPGALALADAVKYHVGRLASNLDLTAARRRQFLHELALREIPHRILSPEDGSPYVLALSFPGIRGETLMHALSAESIYISTGSACGSKKGGENRVLTAMGFDRATILSAVRISFNPNQSPEEIRHLADRIAAHRSHYALEGQ
ncbi:MAG TPA: cysteine desulfurase family protein [Bacillota bacterium]|nr:cysteine desulfurase [Fastidiosipila sp.]HPX93541.1 cysteine desulfurase family protein [Bacillota bacterium]HQB81772.1 cysteine desulfurase family protein [Bacillota bacterium]